MNSEVLKLEKALQSGFINHKVMAIEQYKPRLIINDPEKGMKVLTSLISELKKCDSFYFSVAFITESGVTTLLNTLMELDEKGIQGKIIASQYQNFSEPKALKKLLLFKNIDLKIMTESTGKMHTKGYIFKIEEEYTVIVGSSNLTQYALCENNEWNLKVTSTSKGSLIQSTLEEFDRMFEMATKVDDLWIDQYEEIYREERRVRQNVLKEIRNIKKPTYLSKIYPNGMQVKALNALSVTREEDFRKALIVSATGTGKTYLSAFDVKKFNPERFLFVVHREQIAKAAMESFERIFEGEKTMSILSGNHRDLQADFIFSTIQTMSKDHMLHEFERDAFDYIVIDEVHRAGAESYQKVINYFTPKFLLGMSATPERTDGFDIYELFDRNVAFEIRLNDAMKEGMICPFHYFGVTELTIEGQIIDDKTEFNLLTSDRRVEYIQEKMSFYGYSGERVKGLVFCSRNEEARILAHKFQDLGFRTLALSGKNTQEERMDAVTRLGQDDPIGALDYIFTVDIFNEGVDIPEVNQVVMLRPTQSAIIFVQQLGRGLRKIQDKEYVVVLDFIGNYENNFLIPMALSEDRSYNKDNVRRYVEEGSRTIYGCSTINFDSITKERVYKSIDQANFNDLKIVKDAYMNLKQRLGRIPRLEEFEKYGSINIERIFGKKKSYHNFLKNYDDDYNVILTPTQEKFIEYVSMKYTNGKRPHELELVRLLLEGKEDVFGELERILREEYAITLHGYTRDNLINQMTQNFITGAARKSYEQAVFLEKRDGDYRISMNLKEALKDSDFRVQMEELIHIGLEMNKAKYSERYDDTNFVLYEKYTYEDVCRCLDWEKNLVPLNIGGYKYDVKTKTFPVFVNYDKHEGIAATTHYEDEFLTPSHFKAISKSKRNLKSDDVVRIYEADKRGIAMSLFVRKNKDDLNSKEFYFLGHIFAEKEPIEFIMPNTSVSAVELFYRIEKPVREDLYDYLTRG